MLPRVNLLMSDWVRNRTALRGGLILPSDAPFVSVPGPDPDRVLVVGSGPAIGVGVRTQAFAIIGHLARSLAAASGRGAIVECMGKPDQQIGELGELLAGARLNRYDAIVVVGGMLEAATLISAAAWRRSLMNVIAMVRREAPNGTALAFVGMPPATSIGVDSDFRGRIADRRVAKLNAITASVANQSRTVQFVQLRTPDEITSMPIASAYAGWADDIAGLLAPLLTDGAELPEGPRSVRSAADSEQDRLAALERVGHPRTAELAAVSALAHKLLGGDIAAVGFLDETRHWFASIVGLDTDSIPRELSPCNETIRSDAPLVIGDLHAERRFDGNPVVHGSPPIRFYAGVAVESPDGYRIGTVCVLGIEPRDPSSASPAILQQLSGMARAAVWQSVVPAGKH